MRWCGWTVMTKRHLPCDDGLPEDSGTRGGRWSGTPTLRRGDSVYLVGLSRSLQATSRKSVVTNPCAAFPHITEQPIWK
ncbi:hypothetical protein SESBI_41242 [Sesbania bispinosa]|nr:hypothetical protein SESBI_41242 [Sesbania bispinosa]